MRMPPGFRGSRERGGAARAERLLSGKAAGAGVADRKSQSYENT